MVFYGYIVLGFFKVKKVKTHGYYISAVNMSCAEEKHVPTKLQYKPKLPINEQKYVSDLNVMGVICVPMCVPCPLTHLHINQF